MSGELTVIGVEDLRIERPLHMVWLRGRSLSPCGKAYVDLVVEMTRESGRRGKRPVRRTTARKSAAWAGINPSLGSGSPPSHQNHMPHPSRPITTVHAINLKHSCQPSHVRRIAVCRAYPLLTGSPRGRFWGA